MSAYVVDDITINKVVSWLALEHYTSVTHSSCGDYLAEAGYDMRSRKGQRRLAEDMFALNVKAVNERYGEGEAAKFRPLNFSYRFIAPPHAIVTVKALHCWLYQCAEGDVPGTDLYELMHRIANAICRGLVVESEAYRAAD